MLTIDTQTQQLQVKHDEEEPVKQEFDMKNPRIPASVLLTLLTFGTESVGLTSLTAADLFLKSCGKTKIKKQSNNNIFFWYFGISYQ